MSSPTLVPPSAPESPQPKISQKLLLRTAGLLFVLAILFFGYQYFRGRKGDFETASKSTGGMIAAVQYQDDGQQVVAIKPDGTIVGNLGWQKGDIDRDIAWQPDGGYLFFVSDRIAKDVKEKGVKTLNIYRWNPETNVEPTQRTMGTRGRNNPSFAADADPTEKPTALITSGGYVLEFDSEDRSTRQVLPPVGKEVTSSGEEGNGSGSQFAIYQSIGNSFRVAVWLKNRRYIAAIMRRDEGEVLVVQDMDPKDERAARPQPIAAAEHLDIAVDPKNGNLIYVVQGFQWPMDQPIPAQFKKNGKILTPYRHALISLDPAEGKTSPIAISPNDTVSFSSPAVSPDGSKVAIVAGPFDSSGSVTPKELDVMPVQEFGVRARATLVKGEVYEPSWNPAGDLLVYAKRVDGKRSIFTVRADGEDERNISGGQGNFGYPVFSPQTKQ